MTFVLRRLASMALTGLLASLLTFGAFNILPGDPAALILGTEATPEQLAALRIELGTDRPLYEQYGSWLKGLFTGQLGTSIRYHRPIAELVRARIPVTFTLAAMALVLTLLFSLPISLLAARYHDSAADKAIGAATTVSMTLPDFFLGVIIVWVFGIVFKLFIPGRFVPATQSFSGYLGYLFWPALAVSIPASAMVIRFLRASLVEEIKSGYYRTARAIGNTKTRALTSHVLKNAAIPAVTMLGMIVGSVFSGSIILERVFTAPGIGLLLISSITSRDLPMAQTLVMFIAAIVVLANAMVDVAIGVIDPRIKMK